MKYHIFDPTGNITVLIEGERDIAAANAVMKAVPDAEQVGFLTEGGLKLTMTGGEFCGNASMCAAALYYSRTGEKYVQLKVSGADDRVPVTVSDNGDCCYCTVEMPSVRSIEKTVLVYGESEYTVFAVRMQGICHLIMSSYKMEKADAEAAAVKWCSDLCTDAVGLMFYDSEKAELIPLVYVKEADTLFWESSCASGTSAVGAYLSHIKCGAISKDIKEPAGVLHVEVTEAGKIKLSGNVRIR